MSRIVFGVHPVEELLARRGAQVSALFVAHRGQHGPLVQRAEARQIPVSTLAAAELDGLCQGGNHQGVAATVGHYPYLDLEQLLDRVGQGGGAPLLVAADSLMDPQNLGSIIRTSVVLGVDGLVLPRDRSVPITPTVVRVSAGGTEHLACAQVTNLARSLARLREAGLWVAGTVERGGVHPADAALDGPLVLVVGSEQKGIRPLVLKQCDIQLTVPSAGGIASLNVAAATAVVLYEIARQRRIHST